MQILGANSNRDDIGASANLSDRAALPGVPGLEDHLRCRALFCCASAMKMSGFTPHGPLRLAGCYVLALAILNAYEKAFWGKESSFFLCFFLKGVCVRVCVWIECYKPQPMKQQRSKTSIWTYRCCGCFVIFTFRKSWLKNCSPLYAFLIAQPFNI